MFRILTVFMMTLLLSGFLCDVCAKEMNCGDLHTLVSWMTGKFSSREQSAQDSAFFDIRLVMTRIWPERSDGYWLYVEQAVASAQERPYRQRVYHVTHVGNDIFQSAVFSIDNPDSFAGAWSDTSLLSALTESRIHLRTGCEIILRKRDESYVGSTLGRLCGSELHGASYATSEVVILADRLISWDRGFNGEGDHVWGAETGGYVFRKVEDLPVDWHSRI